MSVSDFQEQVYALLVQIPQGRVTTYGAIARALKTSPRAVGNALRNNPFAPEVPCHRCIGSTGYITGFDGELIRRNTFKRSKDGKLQGAIHQSDPKGSKAAQQAGINELPHPGRKVDMKIRLLKSEGVEFDSSGMLVGGKKVIWDGPWTL